MSNKHSRTLIIAWGRDKHMGATLGDLIEAPSGAFVVDDFWDMGLLSGVEKKVYDCMDVTKSNVKHQKIKVGSNDGERVVVIKSAYPIQNPDADFKRSFGYLNSLTFSEEVRGMLMEGEGKRVGVHVRNKIDDAAVRGGDKGGGGDGEVNKKLVDYMGLETSMRTRMERGASGWEQFVEVMKEVEEEIKGGVKFYVAADNGDAYEGLKGVFGDRIVWLEREVMDDTRRGTKDVQYAMADMINLGRTEVILGSLGSR